MPKRAIGRFARCMRAAIPAPSSAASMAATMRVALRISAQSGSRPIRSCTRRSSTKSASPASESAFCTAEPSTPAASPACADAGGWMERVPGRVLRIGMAGSGCSEVLFLRYALRPRDGASEATGQLAHSRYEASAGTSSGSFRR
jgi:hypothetical protein